MIFLDMDILEGVGNINSPYIKLGEGYMNDSIHACININFKASV